MPPIVPPGGFAGFSQMTAASRAALSAFGRRTRTSGKRRKRRTSSAKSSRKRTSSRKRGRKLKFGSPAWRKKYMK
jgi:hypothetical protein